MHRTRSLLKVLMPAAAAAAVALPAAADASVSCVPAFDGSLDVTLSAPGDAAKIVRDGSSVKVNGSSCGNGVSSIPDIDVTDTSNGNTSLTVDLTGGELAPGSGFEVANPEIELAYHAGAGLHDTLNVIGGSGDEKISGGKLGAPGLWGLNLNVSDTSNDSDLTVQAVEHFNLEGRNGNDNVKLNGADGGFAGQVAVGAVLVGGGDHDVLIGGDGDDLVEGNAGNDSLNGAGGSNTVAPGVGDDKAMAGPLKEDVLVYDDAPGGVHVDLSTAGQQFTSSAGTDLLTGFRKLVGTKFADRLTGTNLADVLVGGNGDDVLIPRDGDDLADGGGHVDTVSYATETEGGVSIDLGDGKATGAAGADDLVFVERAIGTPFDDTIDGSDAANELEGGAGFDALRGLGGDDVMRSRDDAKDTVECGDGTDTAVADHAGLDTLDACETADRSGAPPAPAPAAPAPAAPAASAPVAVAPVRSAEVVVAPLRLSLSAKARQRAGRRIAATVSCNRACAAVVRARVRLGRKSLALPVTRSAAGRVAVRVPRKALAKIRSALRRGVKPTARLTLDGTRAAATVKLVR